MTASTPTGIQTTSATAFPQWQPATWEDYLAYRDEPKLERVRLFFHRGQLLIEMGVEEINHASISDLFTMLIAPTLLRHRVHQLASVEGAT